MRAIWAWLFDWRRSLFFDWGWIGLTIPGLPLVIGFVAYHELGDAGGAFVTAMTLISVTMSWLIVSYVFACLASAGVTGDLTRSESRRLFLGLVSFASLITVSMMLTIMWFAAHTPWAELGLNT